MAKMGRPPDTRSRAAQLFGHWMLKVGTPDGNDGCWIWIGSRSRRSNGALSYGTVNDGNKSIPAHRAAWELFRFPIPNGLHVLHRCDNVACVNPEHLFLGTHRDNMRDCREKGRMASGERSSTAKLTSADVVRIRTLRRIGVPIRVLSGQFGVHHSVICRVANSKTWKHVPTKAVVAS